MLKSINNKPAFIFDHKPRFLGVKYNPTKTISAKLFNNFLRASNIPLIELFPVKTHSNIGILDQGDRSDCVGHGFVTMLMKTRDSAGLDYYPLSPTFIYNQINNNEDNGSDPNDASWALQRYGTCLLTSCPEHFSLDRKDISDEAYQEATRFIVPPSSIYALNTFEQLCSAFILGFKAGFTINVGNTFELNNDEVITYTPGDGNHWVAVGEQLKQIKTQSGYEWALEFDNSWSSEWGNQGKAFITSRHIDNQSSVRMFAIRYVSDDPMI
jgi:hypothetical protein